MTSVYLAIGMALCAIAASLSHWRNKKRPLGNVPLLPPHYVQLTMLIIFLVLAANLFSDLTGVKWDPPFRR